MALTILQIAQSAALREGLLNNISSVATPTSNFEKQFSEILQVTGRHLTHEFFWTELIKTHFITLIDGQDYYPLPADFLAPVYDTTWNTSQHWPVQGPMSPQEWMTRKFGWIASTPYNRFNVRGSSTSGTFIVEPKPDSSTDGQVITFQYMSSAWCRPTSAWTASTAYTTSSYVYTNEAKIQHNGWTSVSDTWAYASASTITVPSGAASVYTVGDMVKLTQTTVKYFYITAVADTELTVVGTASTYTVANAVISSVYYATQNQTMPPELTVLKAGNSTTSGATSPTLNTGYSDTAVRWVVQSYERFLADTDICLLDEELLALGTVWRYLRAQGKPYEEKKAEYDAHVREHYTYNKGARTIAMSSQDTIPLINYYNIPDSGIGL